MRVNGTGCGTVGARPTVESKSASDERGVEKEAAPAAIEIRRYVKPDGWVTRYWAIYIGGELLSVVVYKKGAEAIAERLLGIVP